MHSKPVTRRRHSAEFKTKVLADCNEPGASIAAVALSHGLNANLVRKWLTGRGLKRTGIEASVDVKAPAAGILPSAAASVLAADVQFLPIELAVPATAARAAAAAAGQTHCAPAASEPIHIELRRGPLHLTVRWPSSAADDCTAWLTALSSGLLK